MFKVKIKTYTYTYDNTSNITSDNNKNYTYDQLYRLTQTTNTNNETLENFTYDNMWNRLTNNNTQVWSWATYEYLNNNLNQYTTQSWTTQNYIIQEIVEEIQTETQTESGTIYGTGTQITYTWSLVTTTTNTNYTYDDNWNLTNDWNYKYIYDYKNRLLKVTNQDDELIVEYTYDILDRRYKKETSTKLVQYTYSNENIVKEEITDKINTTTQTKTYINWLWIDNVIAYDLDNTRYYYHKNHLWSIDWLTDSNWNQVITYDYDVYWNTYVLDNWNRVNIINYTWSTFENDRLFTWREYDKEINLYYNRARYYSPELGRFISRDPIDIQDDVNLYAYVGDNPINYTDSSWEIKQFIAWATLWDYNRDWNLYSIAWQIAIWFTPVWIAWDIRDFNYALNNWTLWDIAMAGIAFIPLWWDWFKALKKSGVVEKGVVKARWIALKMSKKIWDLDCIKFAKKFWKALQKEWIGFEKLILKNWNDFIYSVKNGVAISSNWYHEAIKVWDTVFDNIYKAWIKYSEFLEDLWVWLPWWPKIFK